MSGSGSSSHKITTVNIPPAEQSDSEPRPLYKPYVCDDCDQAFATSGHLTRHQRVHTGETKYECSFPGCGKRCSRKDNLRQHYQLHFDVRDPEALRRAAPEKRRRKTRVTRVAAVDGPGQWIEYTPASPGSVVPSPTASTSDNSEQQGQLFVPTVRNTTNALPSFGVRQLQLPNPPYSRHSYPALPPTQAQYAPPPRMGTRHSLSASLSSSNTSFSSPQYGPLSTSSRIVPAHHSPTASMSSDGSSFPSPYQPLLSPPYFPAGYPQAGAAPGRALPFPRQGHGAHAPSYGHSDMSASAYPTQMSPPYPQGGYPHPPRQPQQYTSPPADALDNAPPFSRRGGPSNERADMPPYPPGPYNRST
ncbi:hypothetical protein MVEN_02161400 [Mycena venus]|uniref:C2H2-type domain-containing protein n=1 Tax=Mycena venus TaxID=2733690 RepID=A0A8H6X8P7_9AGAR|nr:hypothetical protein MVEN_02161400 [Mycena venus]